MVGMIDKHKIILLLTIVAVVVIAGCTKMGQTQQPAQTQPNIVCNTPYIQVGGECCLDSDNNSICDTDEKTTTTAKATTVASTVESTTTVEPTTSIATTTSLKITCSVNADCGGSTLGSIRCYQDQVVQDITSYRCSKPGTANSKCIGNIKTKFLENCDERCLGGKCTDEDGIPISDTRKCAWDQDDCTDHCDSQCSSRAMQVLNCDWDESTCKCTAYCNTGTTPTTTTPTTSISACDCSTLSGGWSNSISCDGAHEEIQMHATCSGCARCNEVCPEDEGRVGYYRFAGCSGACYSDLCRLVENAEPQSAYKDCYKCYAPVCGNGVVESGEQCEVDADCTGYGYCDVDCECQPDCISYCINQGVNGDGYQWINNGLGGSPNIGSEAACTNWANNKLNDISQECFTSCVATAHYSYNGAYSCCCVDWNSLPCQDCPGQNPICPPANPVCINTL